ncbi:MAG: energy transducer TonB [Bacteroidales bacterium]|nr:energy transducer TonB [Bacteroidales bacterium]
MKRGKHICNQLKAVRRRIADENGIPLEQRECTHTGDCRGTCPYCEAEMRYLEQALTHRLTVGKVATVAGMTLSLAACGGANDSTLRTDAPLDSPRTMERPAGDEERLPPDSTLVEGLEPDQASQHGKQTNCKDSLDFIDMLGLMVVIDSEDIRGGESPKIEKPREEELVEEESLEGEETVYVFVEEEASFPGGEEALFDYITKNLQYPLEGREGMVTGTVVVKFVVEKDGTLTNVQLLRDIGMGCGKEAVRMVKGMPKWIPGKNNGKAVRSIYTLPLNFDLK